MLYYIILCYITILYYVTLDITYSMYGHISYILEPNSKRPNDFSLIRRKPNEILQFKVKKTYDIKIRAEIKFGIHAEGE